MLNSTLTTTEKFTECPKCGSTNLIRVTGKDEKTCHYGRLQCGTCDRFITWLKDPSITLNTQLRSAAIDRILTEFKTKLTAYDYRFLISNKDKRYLSEKQQKYLNVIAAKTIGQPICAIDAQKITPNT